MKDRFCLNSVASFKDINGSHTNRSKTKQTFSFCLSPRFDSTKSYCDKNTYGGQPLRRKNSGAGIGYGKKSDFTQCLSISPGSSKYQIRDIFDDSVRRKTGCSIGVGRDKFIFDSYIDKEICKVPGSTKYNTQKSLKIQAPLYTMRQKTKILNKNMTIDPQNTNPGPGSYENPEIDLNSSNFSSKFQRIGYSSSRSHRFDSSDTKTPGPGKYNDVSNLSSVGRYIVSTHKGGTIAKFNRNKRITKFDQVAKQASPRPGPGNYKAPSEFGQYDGDIYRFQTVEVSRRK